MAALGVHWPVRLTDGDLLLRPLRLRDARMWREVREINAAWLRPWEATLPQPESGAPATFGAMVRQANREARAGRALPFGIFRSGSLIGQITVAGISWSSLRTCHIGYWVDQRHAGQGIMPRCLAMVGDFCFSQLQLHRIEVNIRPENQASLAVVRKLGFRNEGLRLRYLHIDGRWCDHVCFALTAEERRKGMGAWLGRTDRSGDATSFPADNAPPAP